MKQTLERQFRLDTGELVEISFEHWPATPDTRLQPGDAAEINILSIKDSSGNLLSIPTIEDDGGNGEYERIVKNLFLMLEDEQWDAR